MEPTGMGVTDAITVPEERYCRPLPIFVTTCSSTKSRTGLDKPTTLFKLFQSAADQRSTSGAKAPANAQIDCVHAGLQRNNSTDSRVPCR